MRVEKWINIGKAMAIIAVITNHTYGSLYTNASTLYLSFFSVSLFVLLTGVTTYWSYDNSENRIGSKVVRRILGMACPYVVATIGYSMLAAKEVNLEGILSHIVFFNASAPFYFVLLYLQLLLITPVIFLFIKLTDKFNSVKRIMIRLLIGAGIILFAAASTNYSNILGVSGGGGKLFGGTYLILLYAGMLFGCRVKDTSMKKTVLGGCVFILLTILSGVFVSKDKCAVDAYFPFGLGINPPGISLMLYAASMMGSIYFLTKCLINTKSKILHGLLNTLDYVGKHTLYIFLYHRMFLDYFLCKVDFGNHIWLKCVVFYCVMIGGSILIEMICHLTWKNCVCRAYLYRKDDFERK